MGGSGGEGKEERIHTDRVAEDGGFGLNELFPSKKLESRTRGVGESKSSE